MHNINLEYILKLFTNYIKQIPPYTIPFWILQLITPPIIIHIYIIHAKNSPKMLHLVLLESLTPIRILSRKTFERFLFCTRPKARSLGDGQRWLVLSPSYTQPKQNLQMLKVHELVNLNGVILKTFITHAHTSIHPLTSSDTIFPGSYLY